MKIRLMTSEDYDGIRAVWESCTGMGLNSVDDTKEGIARFLVRNPQTCFVAEEDGHIVGGILAGNDGRRGYIYHTAVHPDARGRGIGSALFETVLAAMKSIGIAKVAGVVFARNEGGNAFWEKQKMTTRPDLVYRNRTITEFERYDS